MKKSITLFITFLSIILFTNSVLAAKCSYCARPDLNIPIDDRIVQVGSPYTSDGGTLVYSLYRNKSNKRVFCLKKGATTPAYGATGDWNSYYICNTDMGDFSMKSKYKGKSDNLKAAIGYAIEWYKNEKDGSDDGNYRRAQKVIWNLLYDYTSNSERDVDGNNNIYDPAVKIFKKYGTEEISISDFDLRLKDGKWQATVPITKNNIDSVSINSLKKGSKSLKKYAKIDGNNVIISIPQSNLSSGDNVTLKITGTTIYQMAQAKICGENIQSIAEVDTTTKTITKTVTATGTAQPNVLTVNYYNGSTKVGTATYEHDEKYSTGLTNYSTFNISKEGTGKTGTGNWIRKDNTNYKVNENTGFNTGQALAQALGKSIASGNASVDVKTEWNDHALTVNYYNGSTKVGTATYEYDEKYSTGLTNYSTFNISKELTGKTGTGNWIRKDNTNYKVNENTGFNTGQALAQALGKSIASGNASVDVKTEWNDHALTVNYYNGSTKVGTATYEYDEKYSNGLTNYSTFNISKELTGKTGTGNWIRKDNTNYKVNESTGFNTGQALAQALGKSIASGNASVDVKTEWNDHALTVNYYNGSTKVGTATYEYDEKYSNGLTNYSTFNISKEGTGKTGTGNWIRKDNTNYKVNENTGFNTGQALAQALGKSIASGNASVDVKTEWNDHALTVVYHSNDATNIKYNKKTKTESYLNNDLTQTFTYDEYYENGLRDGNNSSSLNITKTGHHFSGNWLVGSENSTTKISQSFAGTGKEIAEKMGKSIDNQSLTVHVYGDWNKNTLKVVYHSNGATSIQYQKTNITEKQLNDIEHVFYYDIHDNYGLLSAVNQGVLYMTKIGHNIGENNNNWLVGSANSTTKISQSFSGTGKEIAEKMGTSIDNQSQVVHVYVEWVPNRLKVRFHANGGEINSDTYKLKNNIVFYKDNKKYLHGWVYNVPNVNGLVNVSTFGMTNPGHIFLGWGTSPNGGKVFNEDDTTVRPTDLSTIVETKDNETITVYAQWEPIVGNLEIIKETTTINPATNQRNRVQGTVTFEICSDSLCRNEPTPLIVTNGKGTIALNAGKYYIREMSAPSQYFVDSNNIQEFTISTDRVTKLTIINQTWCEKYFNDNPSVIGRINLFNTNEQSKTFNNLLNFNLNNANLACTHYSPSYEKADSCLYTKQNTVSTNQFSANDLSAFNDTVKDNDGTNAGYCLTKFEIKNAVSMPSKAVKSGMLVLGSKTNNRALTGVLTKTCYVYKPTISNLDQLKYNDYVDEITLGNKALLPAETNKIANLQFKQTETNGLKRYEAQIEMDYYFPKVSVYKISGAAVTNGTQCSGSVSNCVDIGYGILSNFNDGKTLTNNFDFKVKFKSKNNPNPAFEQSDGIFKNSSSTCTYTVDPEIIKYDNNEKGDLDIEFRTIDSKNPFNRPTNSNWSNGTDNSKNNDVVREYINEATNSHGIKNGTKQEPKYTIILTPDDILQIREHNNSSVYDDYQLCTEGSNCQNKNLFLDTYIKKGVITK